jgi:phospholipid transport system substrate-binding protein
MTARRDSWRGGLRRRRIVQLLLPVLLLALVPSTSVVAEDDPAITDEPRKMIDETAKQILAVLSNKDESAAERVARVELIAFEVFDFTTISKLVLARNWRKLDKAKRAEFVREFKRHLSRTYGARLERYDQERFEVTGAQLEPRNDVSVMTMVIGGQFDSARVSYRLRNRSGRWRIIDVVIEGVSMVSNFRSQFAEVLNSGSIEDLLARLREKNATPILGAQTTS